MDSKTGRAFDVDAKTAEQAGGIRESLMKTTEGDVSDTKLPEDLKVQVNEFLFLNLPGATTLKKLDEIAGGIYHVIMSEWER